ncbi:TonB-dependent receptor plug domain-containing protein [Sphingomonas crusticola]|uniref:TonB-dependent receptor plug domain-containing protein n=1 Tax=Sphingomonas crusticola TaxID=1697973 RepID=UPI0013C354AB|nr:TonB-dependent receptor [Sphingomonas crusticola]
MVRGKGKLHLLGVSLLPLVAAGWAPSGAAAQAPAPVQSPADPAPQTQAPDTSPTGQDAAVAETNANDVIVTGSRISRRGFETPTPTTAISVKQLEAKAALTVTDIIAEIPSMRPNQNSNNSSNAGQSLFDLRGIGSNRTLVLLDGLRLVDTSPIPGGVNANILPAALINRVEVVTGGASSAYGSDAITGVVNIGLISSMTGGKIDVQGTIGQTGDDRQKSISASWGHNFLNDRLHFVVAGSYFRQPNIIRIRDRDWGREGYTRYQNTAANIAAGQAGQIIGPGGAMAQMTFGGVITSGPLAGNRANGVAGTQFLGNGVTAPFNYGAYCGGNVYCQGGDGVRSWEIGGGVIRPKADRYTGYSRLSYDIGETSSIYASVLYSYDKEIQTNVPNYNNGDLVIRRENYFLPAQIRTALGTTPTFTLGRINIEDGFTRNTAKSQYLRLLTGAEGQLSFLEGWKWDTHFAYTRATYDSSAQNNRVQSRFLAAVDAIANPAVGGVPGVAVGAPICRSTIANPSNGCVPINLFGPNTISDAGKAYYLGTSWTHTILDQYNAGGNLRGDLFNTWAGPVSFATGAEYRRDGIRQTSDPISAITGWRQASGTPFHGSNWVREGYAEAVIPLTIPNFALMKKFEIDTAIRVADYQNSGTATVWKVGANYEVNDSIRFRATYSHDFRAPSVNELFSTPVTNNGASVIDRQPGPNQNQSVTVLTITGGNRDLQPEKAKTLTYGVVLSPAFFPGFRFSADVYRINMDNAITAFSIQDVVNNCYLRSQDVFCGAITRDPVTGKITVVQALSFNAQVLKVNGIDFEARYAVPLADMGVPGSLVLGSLVSYVQHVKTVVNAAVQENAGFLTGTNATPRWRASNTITYDLGRLTLRSLVTVVGAGRYSATYPTAADISPYHWKAQAYVDISAQYRINDHFEIYGKINNLLDKDPPFIADNAIIKALPNSSSYYDNIGRVYGLGARYRW